MNEEDISSKISVNLLDETVCLDGEDLTEFCFYPSSSERQNHVYWDLVQYPIPPDANLQSVKASIRAALDKMGLHSCETVFVYGGIMNHSKDDLRKARILHLPQGELAVDLLFRAANSRSPLNFIVIPRPDTKSELHRVLKGLQSRHHNILLVNPHAHDGPFLFDSGQSIVECTEDLDGGKPIIGGRRTGDTTPVIKDARSLAYLFESVSKAPGRTAFVFWDLAKYITPTEANVVPFGTGIREALQRLGHHGCVEILAFGAYKLTLRRDSDSYKKARIIRIPEGLYENAWQLFLRSNPGPLMVIPTIDPSCLRFSGPDWSLNSLLRKPGHYDLLFVTPPPVDEGTPEDVKFLHNAHLILGCTDGFYEGKKITRGRREVKDIQEFSKPITFLKGATEGQFVFVFWNLEDFPFPTGLTPDAIYEKIESVFLAYGYELRNMLIWAYVDDKEGSWGGDFLRKKTWESSIYFLPVGGDKSAIRDRMLHDILLWTKDSHPAPAVYLVIVSNEANIIADKEFSSALEMLAKMSKNVIVETGSSFFQC
ncbi:unnamed protein product [Microthlaspi erraticum]|uniref:NYN domain-containing protein n=1 Tax=Microthlaspi erraticum TaxID=1685480 RepID=A0A6D2LIP4_9BRAS|nr:unnamed protein product [Microthlaspi erraticum]